MKLVIGLGNPGKEYEHTRHNLGFALLDHLVEEFGSHWQAKNKLKASIAEVGFGGQKVILAKPTTYYNLSGEAVREVCDFYHIEVNDALVIHDELALPFGTLRVRVGGSDAGNNGIKNITAHLGQHYARIRVGIGNAQADTHKAEVFVLEKLTKEESKKFDALAKHTVTFVEDFIHEDKKFAHISVSL